jgi:hypothetical protein
VRGDEKNSVYEEKKALDDALNQQAREAEERKTKDSVVRSSYNSV